MKALLVTLAVFGMCLPAQGSSLFERYVYSYCGKNYYGYRPYAAPSYKPGDYHAENYSRVYNLSWHYHQPPAAQGSTVYGISDFDPSAAYAGKVSNSSAILAEKFIEASVKTSTDAGEFDRHASNTQGVVVREIVANQRLQLLAQATKVDSSAQINHSQPSVPSKPVPSQPVSLSATETACQACHAADVAESKGNGNSFGSFADFSAEQADIALEYITRTDANNCSKKANLSPEAQKALVKLLCKKANQ